MTVMLDSVRSAYFLIVWDVIRYCRLPTAREHENHSCVYPQITSHYDIDFFVPVKPAHQVLPKSGMGVSPVSAWNGKDGRDARPILSALLANSTATNRLLAARPSSPKVQASAFPKPWKVYVRDGLSFHLGLSEDGLRYAR